MIDLKTKKYLKEYIMNFKKNMIVLFALIGLALTNQKSFAHCEIPCGIYHDSIRVALIKEHIETIEKSMNMINKLSGEASLNYNQIVRWVMNKEDHATKIQEIVSQYFLHQRIKPTDPSDKEHYDKYVNELKLLHELLVYSMKAKQGTDLTFIEKLRSTVDSFEKSYFGGHKHH
jgi:nickel superoxide dismutase